MGTLTWTDERVDEFKDLELLLVKARSLNNGNQFLENVAGIIKISEKLLGFDLSNGRPNFLEFVKQQAIKDRQENLKKE